MTEVYLANDEIILGFVPYLCQPAPFAVTSLLGVIEVDAFVPSEVVALSAELEPVVLAPVTKVNCFLILAPMCIYETKLSNAPTVYYVLNVNDIISRYCYYYSLSPPAADCAPTLKLSFQAPLSCVAMFNLLQW